MKSGKLQTTLFSGALLLCCGHTLAQQTTTTRYEYDAQGNLTRITDPLGRVTDQRYDALNRLTQQLQPAPTAGAARPVIQYAYDGLDQLIAVTDPRNLLTRYTIDGLGNQTAMTSPDTGSSSQTYDAAGNVVTRTDAKGQTTRYQYDVLNRVTAITYADGNAVAFAYDQGPNGLGRLTQITDAAGTITYSYDQHGRVLTDTRTVGTTPYVTSYRYDAAGRLATVTYPSGRIVAYTRDVMGRIAQIDTTKDGVTHTLVSQVQYHPFGGVKSFVNGANVTVTRSMDLDGRTTGYTLASSLQALSYDPASRLTDIADTGNAAAAQHYGYDDLDRLTSYQGSGGSQTLTYDLTGNRTSQTIGTAVTSYSISPASNRLTQRSGPASQTYSYDANGSTTGNGTAQFAYDARGRLIAATTAQGTIQYLLNALGQRVQKRTPTQTTVFHYDQAGHLIGETAAQGGQGDRDYVYLHDLPVAVLQ